MILLCCLLVGVWLRGAVCEKQGNVSVFGFEGSDRGSKVEELRFHLRPF